jgi:ABC-2 type transport system ATP-binding protein
VLFSTHLLADVERIADRVALLHEGRLLLHRELDELRGDVRRVRLVFPGEAPRAVPGLTGILRTRRAGRELLLTLEGFDEARVARLAQETSAQVDVQPVGLEELFIDLVGEGPRVAA